MESIALIDLDVLTETPALAATRSRSSTCRKFHQMALKTPSCRVLHPSQPVRYSFGIKPNARSHPERWNPAGGGLFEDRHLGDGEQLREFTRGDSVTDPLDL